MKPLESPIVRYGTRARKDGSGISWVSIQRRNPDTLRQFRLWSRAFQPATDGGPGRFCCAIPFIYRGRGHILITQRWCFDV